MAGQARVTPPVAGVCPVLITQRAKSVIDVRLNITATPCSTTAKVRRSRQGGMIASQGAIVKQYKQIWPL